MRMKRRAFPKVYIVNVFDTGNEVEGRWLRALKIIKKAIKRKRIIWLDFKWKKLNIFCPPRGIKCKKLSQKKVTRKKIRNLGVKLLE